MNVQSRTGNDDVLWREWVTTLPLLLFVGGCIVAALGIPAWQAYAWLRDGIWHPVGIIDALQVLAAYFSAAEAAPSGFRSWLQSPGSWFGLHKLLSMLHASVGLWAASMVGVYFLQDAERSERATRRNSA